MTEAGPSKSPVLSNPKSHFDSTSSSSSKHVQLGLGLGPPPVPSRRRIQDAENGFTTRNNRRRIRSDSLGKGHVEEGSPLVTKPRLSVKYEMRPAQLTEADANITAFSDEYDLAHEDPAILADVQRALKMKARREARLRVPGPARTDASPHSFFSTSSSQNKAPASTPADIAFPPIDRADTGEDIVTSLDVIAPHPLPRSLDNGATLDWSGKEATEEPKHDRKWSLSITKRKPKDKAISVSSLDHSPLDISRGSNYDERVAKMRERMKSQAVQKASAAAEHIQRRYSFLYASLFPPSRPLNLLHIARWNAGRDSPKSNLHSHSLWHITPSTVEEYLKVQAHKEEEPITNLSSLLPSPMPNGTSPKPEEEIHRPRYPRVQTATSRKTRTMTASPASDNWPSDSPWPRISSPQSDNDSPRSSLYSAFRGALGHISPASSKRHLRDRAMRKLSADSARASLSEPNSQAGSPSPSRSRRQELRTPNFDTQALTASGPESDGAEQHATDMRSPQLSESLLTAKPPESAIPSTATATGPADPIAAVHPPRLPPMRRRTSLPLGDYGMSVEVEKRRQLVDEEREQYEYEIRAQLLGEAIKQNSRIRQQLQRISAEFRDFAQVQKQLIELLNMPFPTVPPEMFDAISHDPAAMMGQTRRLKGWRAVEEVHCRINRQREMLSSFAVVLTEINNQLPRPRGVFDESLVGLMDSLSRLEHHQEDLRRKESTATQKLAHVRELHVLTKMEYNETLGHTSHVYPELSFISALEEKYRNRYQKFWDLGMDALTLLLDSITPFWRSYGKTIGIDIQDFLIIPWYRNEFTGQPKRYPITNLPKRSPQHWLGLLVFAVGCHAFLLLQVRGAVYTTANGFMFLYGQNPGVSILLLPCMIATCLVMWVAVICEFSVIVAQIGVVLWWLGWTVGIFS